MYALDVGQPAYLPGFTVVELPRPWFLVPHALALRSALFLGAFAPRFAPAIIACFSAHFQIAFMPFTPNDPCPLITAPAINAPAYAVFLTYPARKLSVHLAPSISSDIVCK